MYVIVIVVVDLFVIGGKVYLIGIGFVIDVSVIGVGVNGFEVFGF